MKRLMIIQKGRDRARIRIQVPGLPVFSLLCDFYNFFLSIIVLFGIMRYMSNYEVYFKL